MLDPKYIRENLDVVKEGARKKRVSIDIDKWVELDEARKKLQAEVDGKRATQNKASAEIAQAPKEKREELISKVGEIKNELKRKESELKELLEDWKELLMQIPNPPSEKMPEGDSDEDNITVRTWGEVPNFDFEPKDHIQLGKELGVIDIEKAAEVSGSRFYYLKGDLVLLQFALLQFTFKTLGDEKVITKIVTNKGLNISSKPFLPMLPPVMIRDQVQKDIHRVFGDQTYQFKEDKLNLVASAEHTMAPYHMNEVLNEEELPKRYIGYSTAFRREAGTYGKDMGGIFRVHQFDKAEMESFTTAETAEEEQVLIVALQEYMMQELKIPYRLQQVCTGDTGKPDYQQYDIEAWLPGQGKYRETHTSDYMTDYQTRGINSRYKTKEGEHKFLHTNDATAFAMGRTIIAIMENYQTKEGEIIVPKVLSGYVGKDKISYK